jgi:AcrR family transcriptional regulator
VQQQRSAETRDAVVRAAIELVGTGGVEAATAAALSERSGVSWGGIQHQFGNKEAVLDAALDHLVADLAAEWRDLDPGPPTLESRVDALVGLAWRVVRNPSYPPLLALLRRRAARNATITDTEVLRLRAGATRTARVLFADLDLDVDQRTLDLVDAFCFAAVGGIAEQQHLAPIGSSMTKRALGLVATAVLTTLRDEGGG